MEAIFKRTSTRYFTSKDISDELISRLIQAGMQAPSARNEQPWFFIVIDNKDLFSSLINIHKYANALITANKLILVCGDMSEIKDQHFWVQDCAACTENILLEATYLGLGSVWLGVYPIDVRMDYLRQALNLPDYIIPFSGIALGYPQQSFDIECRYKENKIMHNQWNMKWRVPERNIVNCNHPICIHINDMKIYAKHGVLDTEKNQYQLFEVTADLLCNFDVNNWVDRIENTINYAEVYNRIENCIKKNSYNLIETLAIEISKMLIKEYQQVIKVDITVKKPNAPIQGDFAYVGASYSLSRSC